MHDLAEPERLQLARNLDRFFTLMTKLRARYATPDGWVITTRDGKPTKFRRLETLAWRKYVGGKRR